MRTQRLLASLLLLLLVAVTGGAASADDSGAQRTTVPTLVKIRAAHHPGFDRVVFEFRGGLPTTRSVEYVPRLIGDGSGLPIPVPGRAILQVRLSPADAHDEQGRPTAPAREAYALPNAMSIVRGGDFEAVTTYGIGLAKRTDFHVFTLRKPDRVVVDVENDFSTVNRRVYFLNQKRYVDNEPPFFVSRWRPVIPTAPASAVMDRLFAGPVAAERAQGLRLLRSGATGYRNLTIRDGVARVHLTGGCSSGGSTVSIADEIMPTLRQFPSVDWVKIYAPDGTTARPTGRSDSVPECLEP